MFYLTEKALVLPYAIAALSGGFNAAYFWTYRARNNRRRIAALTLCLVNAGIASEALYLAAGLLLETGPAFLPALWLAARLLLCAGALSITLLILKRLRSKPS